MAQQIISINIGKPRVMLHNNKEIQTGICKTQVREQVYLGKHNFRGDGQADLIHHGGEDKAVCVYPFEHYSHWEKVLDRKLEFGAFGENLTINGMPESEVCIGDIYQLGEAVVQVSQPRQPCFKLAAKYDTKDLPVLFQNTGFTGYYFRVLQEGMVLPSAIVTLIEKHPRQISIEFANQVMHHEKDNMEGIKELLEVEALSHSWRETLTKRLAGIENDPKARLKGTE